MPDAAMPAAAAAAGAEDKGGKGGRDPWHDGALKLAANELPAHLRHQLEEALSVQVQNAAK